MKQQYTFSRILGFLPMVLLISWINSNSLNAQTVTFIGGESGTWEVPCGVTQIAVQVWGAGGGGGKGSGNPDCGSGGGGGGYTYALISVTPGEDFTYNVGTGGAGASGGSSDGDPGDPSTFSGAFGTMTANGGGGGAGSSGLGGTGGSSSGGDQNNSGSDGQVGNSTSLPYFGGAGGDNGEGSNGAAAQGTVNGDGIGGGVGGGGSGGNDAGGGAENGGDGGDGQVTISYNSASAGVDQAVAVCDLTTTLSATAVPANTIGTWTVSPAGPSISDVNDPNAAITGMSQDVAYTFTWTVTDNGVTGGCSTSSSDVIVLTRGPLADAGPNQSLCTGSYTAAAIEEEAGFTGSWSVVAEPSGGDISFDDNSLYNTGITSLMSQGECATLRWTVSGACSNSSDVVICNPLTCNDDPCGAYAISLGASCSYTTYTGATATATETTNPDRPGCGQFGQFDNGLDVWYSVTIPADGVINWSLDGASGTYVSAAIYETNSGDCNDLDQITCSYQTLSGGVLTIQSTGLTPGETAYIRVFDYFDDVTPGTFDLCAYGNTNTSDIQPGDNTITCGSSYTFYDPGGTGSNYADNANVVYTLCPDDPDEAVSLDFTSGGNFVDLYPELTDHLVILNGSNGAAQIIADIPWVDPADTYISTATDGCLTVIFMSDPTTTDIGWEATVSCAADPDDPTNDDNHSTGYCTEQNCLGGCLRTLCGIPATVGFQGDGPGTHELGEYNNSCWTAPERCSNWFYINPTSAGDLSLNMYVNNGQDQDFLLWEAFGDELQCPAETGDDPLLCNYAGASPAGTGFNDALAGIYASYEPSLQITADDITNGLYYIINVQTYSNGNSCPQPDVSITFGGSAGLGCEAPIPLGLDITYFDGFNDDRRNIILWDVDDDKDVAYYVVEKSNDALEWTYLTTEYSVNTTSGYRYQVIDAEPYMPFTYYRVRQVDYDGTLEMSHIISVSRGEIDEEWISTLFPNPTSDVFNFQYQGNNFKDDIDVIIYNNVGQVVFHNNYETSQNKGVSINTANLAMGTYRVLVTQADKRIIKKLSILR